MLTLCFDVGSKRTGTAFYDDRIDIVLPLSTIKHASPEALLTSVRELIAARGATLVVLGLPLLPSGERGAQAQSVDLLASKLTGIDVVLFDERYTTHHRAPGDPDATSACEILRTFLAAQASRAKAAAKPKKRTGKGFDK